MFLYILIGSIFDAIYTLYLVCRYDFLRMDLKIAITNLNLESYHNKLSFDTELQLNIHLACAGSSGIIIR